MTGKNVKRKINLPAKPLLELSILLFSGLFIFVFQIFFSNIKNIDNSKAQTAGKTLTVCDSGCLYSGSAGIQQAVDAAQNGDIVVISAGNYSGGMAAPLASNRTYTGDAKGGSETCFIRIEKKNITIKGSGATLYGEGHARAYQDPYQHRAGVCVLDSTVTFDGLRIKEFQKRGMVVVDSTIVYKNGVVDGCDEGGISLLGNSKGLFVNNVFVGFNYGGVMIWQDSQAKIVNNIFYNANVMFFYHFQIDNKAHADIINNIFSNGSKITQVGWDTWRVHVDKIKGNTLSYNLLWGENSKLQCDPALEYCDNFPGKIEADPLFEGPAVDPTGWVYGSFALKDGSPAKNVGDPTIPGPKNLGVEGGPCVNGTSSECTQYVSQFLASSAPTSTPVPTATGYPTGSSTPTPSSTITSTISPTPTPIPIPTVITPTPTLGYSDMKLNLKLKFQGIITKPQDQYNLMKVKVTLQKKSGGGTGKTVDFIADPSGIWSGSVIFPQMTDGSDYQLFIKGPKHLQRKICNNSPAESTPGSYKCDTSSGGISLKLGENNLDLTGIYLFAGDLNQDGIVDSTDVSSVRSALGKSDSQSLNSCDLNNDGVCDTQDFSLVIGALRIRFDDEK